MDSFSILDIENKPIIENINPEKKWRVKTLKFDPPQYHYNIKMNGRFTRKQAERIISKISFSDIQPEILQIGGEISIDDTVISDTSQYEILRNILKSKSIEELIKNIEYAELNCNPPNDENPYFFNMLRLRHFNKAFSKQYGVVKGNLTATVTLVGLLFVLFILSICIIIIPLLLRRKFITDNVTKFSSTIRAGILYFILIGAGFT